MNYSFHTLAYDRLGGILKDINYVKSLMYTVIAVV